MTYPSLVAFADELEKTAFLGKLWRGFLSLIGSDEPEKAKTKNRVDHLFSPKAGPEKWDKFSQRIKSPEYLRQVTEHPSADPKLVQHATSMHDMTNGQTIGKIRSERLTGRSYEIKKMTDGLGCTCPDWRYKGSVTPGYECKHVKAFKAGRVKAPA